MFVQFDLFLFLEGGFRSNARCLSWPRGAGPELSCARKSSQFGAVSFVRSRAENRVGATLDVDL